MASKPKKEMKAKAAKPGKRRLYKKRQPKSGVKAPTPITAAKASPAGNPDEPSKTAGILDSLGSLFHGADNPGEKQLDPSPLSSTGLQADSLPPESERLLASVPEHIGEADDPGGPAEIHEPDPIAALMAQVAFEPQDVQDTLAEFFDWLSKRFESEHWKLTERQARMLGRPSAQLFNSMWARLQDYLPDILSRWCEETPGAMAFIMACGIVVVPKVSQQIKISRERAKAVPLVRDQPSKPQPKPQPITIHEVEKPRVGIVFDGGV